MHSQCARRNLIGGFTASAVSLGIGLLAVPVYLRLLGPEGYALIGLYITLQALLQGLDGGLTHTATREVAAHGSDLATGFLLRALVWIAWGFAALLAGSLWLAAPWLATGWLNVDVQRTREVAMALALMGPALGLRWPAGLYQSILLGADRQLRVSQIQMAASLLAHGGAVAILWWGAPEISLYFGWQILVVSLQVLALNRAAAPYRPATGESLLGLPRFSSLRRVQRFSAGMVALGIVGLLLTSMDKLLLSKLLPLADLGHYMLASTVAGLTYMLATPVFQWSYPYFSRLIGQSTSEQAMHYRRVSHLLACMMAPVLVFLVAGARPLLMLWTRDGAAVDAAAPVLAWLAVGCVFHGATYPAYALILAHGASGWAVQLNLVLVMISAPLMVGLILWAGPVGGGIALAVLHCLSLLVGCWATHRLLLPGVSRDWLARDVGPVLVLALAMAWLGRSVVGDSLTGLLVAAGQALIVLGVLAIASRRLRKTLGWRM